MREVILNNGYVSIVDDDDFDKLDRLKWHTSKTSNQNYARHSLTSKTNILMHRFILNIKDSNLFVDHIDHNGLNNQKSNLRICTAIENSRNRRSKRNGSSKYLGVWLDKKNKKYRSKIFFKKQICLGSFTNENDAALAYNTAALKYFGHFANTNIL